MTNREELRALYSRLELPRPVRTGQPNLDHLLEDFDVDLGLYEADVAGAVNWLLSNRPVPNELKYLLTLDTDLVSRLETIANGMEQGRSMLRPYFDHLDYLRRLLEVAKSTDDAVSS